MVAEEEELGRRQQIPRSMSHGSSGHLNHSFIQPGTARQTGSLGLDRLNPEEYIDFHQKAISLVSMASSTGQATLPSGQADDLNDLLRDYQADSINLTDKEREIIDLYDRIQQNDLQLQILQVETSGELLLETLVWKCSNRVLLSRSRCG